MRIGLYLHIPYCWSRCSYCDFNTYQGTREEARPYVEALIREMAAAGRGESWTGIPGRNPFSAGRTL